ncbi:UDP-4-amino-4,6-dideoxy-N-acetyl-beta-L-altrosamine transaminase [Paenibacillus sp. LjRoot56]|uniref:UDP-4-amino-4, 6-dideoxy-N-acetyl-beta-L-altrosamine transaminase n=1 Tax=Paenibacillus sp. LjRoot56 TaxID=3342333 RepID=UPI003ECE70E5
METLAINGGKPVRASLLPYGQQWVDEQDIQEVSAVLRSSFLTQGPKIEQFEEAVAKQAGATYAVAFCNGTAALHAACFAAGIKEGDEVITSPLTFVASSNCVLYEGGTPVFADVDPETYLLTVEQMKAKLTSRTKAIIPVDFSGQPVNMQAFQAFARENNLVMIQDAAHSFGASYDGQPVGSVADMTMLSFHPVKPVTTAEGGVIVTNNELYAKKLRLFRSHGITRDLQELEHESEGPWYYEMQELGYNYRMTDMQAALGLSQINRLDRFISFRNEIAAKYDAAFQVLEDKGWIRRPVVREQAHSGWHLYILQLKLEHLTVDRRQIFEALRAENIGVNVHYIPVYLNPYYAKLGYKQGLCPTAEQLYTSFITLPLFPKMDDRDVEDTIQAVNKVLEFYAKRS